MYPTRTKPMTRRNTAKNRIMTASRNTLAMLSPFIELKLKSSCSKPNIFFFSSNNASKTHVKTTFFAEVGLNRPPSSTTKSSSKAKIVTVYQNTYSSTGTSGQVALSLSPYSSSSPVQFSFNLIETSKWYTRRHPKVFYQGCKRTVLMQSSSCLSVILLAYINPDSKTTTPNNDKITELGSVKSFVIMFGWKYIYVLICMEDSKPTVIKRLTWPFFRLRRFIIRFADILALSHRRVHFFPWFWSYSIMAHSKHDVSVTTKQSADVCVC